MRAFALRSLPVLMAALMSLAGGQALAYDQIQGSTLHKVCNGKGDIKLNDDPISVSCPESIKELGDDMGYVVVISNPQGKDFVVPNSPSFPANTDESVNKYGKKVKECEDWRPHEGNEESKDDPMDLLHAPFYSPLYTLKKWKEIWEKEGEKRPKLAVMINANWFDVRGEGGFPHKYPCTNIYGLAVADGTILSTPANINIQAELPGDRGLVFGEALDTIVFSMGAEPPKILQSHQVKYNANFEASVYEVNGKKVQIKNAVSGFIILKDSKFAEDLMRSSNNPDDKYDHSARTVVGMDRDGSTMYIVVVQPGRDHSSRGGATARMMSDLMKGLGAVDAINLDNSGSSQLIFNHDKVEWETRPGDKASGNEVNRPIPLFLGLIEKAPAE